MLHDNTKNDRQKYLSLHQYSYSQGDRQGRPYKKTKGFDARRILVRATLAVALQGRAITLLPLDPL